MTSHGKDKNLMSGNGKDSINKWTSNRVSLPTKCRRGYTETSKRNKVNIKRLRRLRTLKKSWIFFADGIFHKIVLWKSQVNCVVWSYGFKSMPHPFFVLKLAYSCNYKLPFIKQVIPQIYFYYFKCDFQGKCPFKWLLLSSIKFCPERRFTLNDHFQY